MDVHSTPQRDLPALNMTLDPLRVPQALQRPGSSHSNRSVSRASQRPTSRLSQRTITKQPRLAALLKTLVKQVTKSNEEYDTDDIQEGMDMASKRIDQMKQATVPDSTQIETQFRGHMKKARINVQDTLADVLHAKYTELKDNIAQRKDLDMDIKPSTLPSHLQFLLLLSSPPTTAALSQAEVILARKHDSVPQSQALTWENILKEEPFEGQHWQGAYGLSLGSTVEHWEEESSDELSLSDNAEYEEDISSQEDEQPQNEISNVHNSFPKIYKDTRSRAIIEALYDKQYWRPGWRTDANSHQIFDIGEPSTLAPALDGVVSNGTTTFTQQNAFVNEVDAVREVLMMLQGRQSCLFKIGSEQNGHNVEVLLDQRIVHLTNMSQASILGSFTSAASILNHLRHIVKGTYSLLTATGEQYRTFEAFSAAIEYQLHDFDAWCAQQEERISLAHRGRCASYHTISLLSLEQKVDARIAGTFTVLLNITRTIESRRDRSTPSTVSALILNTLLEAIRTRLTINDSRTARALMDVWRESVEPVWSNLERWLRDGIPIRTDLDDGHHKVKPTWDANEFFIRVNPLVDIGSPDFWEGSYTLPPRHSEPISGTLGSEHPGNESSLPVFLMHIAEDVLAAGKAVGLLRAIERIHLVDDDWLGGWIKFKHLTESFSLEGLDGTLENLISDTLLPPCRLAQSWLRQVLVEECELWKHLQGFENVYLMTRGDAMSQFGERLFARMDSRQPWNDFHFLNTAFREVAKLGSQSWINASLVRFSHRGNKDRNISRTVRAIDGLAIEYAVPFPLTYMFGPESSAGYSSLFCFLLQIRRSKSVLDRILIRGLNRGVLDHGMPDLKIFHVLRGKLSWFVNTIMNFVMTNVIHASLVDFRKVLQDAGSLDEMISIHRFHLERLLGRCLLQPNTSALHRAILSVFDLSLHFSDCLSAFAGDTSLDVSRHSLVLMRHRHRRRSRGGRARKPDVIGFAEALPLSENSDSEAEDAEVETSVGDASISLTEESFFTRLDRMASELDGLVRFIRRGVESLAAGAGEASATFGVLAFSLEDWDL